MKNKVTKVSNFGKNFQKYVKQHQNLYNVSKVKAINFEELFYKSLLDCGVPEKDIEWERGSHKTGGDMIVHGINVSCKGGVINKNKLVFSGQRTTSYKTIQEKIVFLNDKKEDIYMNMATENDCYRLISFSTDIIDFGTSDEWTENNKCWYMNKNSIEFKIQKSMSDQLWITIDLSVVDVETIMVMKM